MKMARWRAARSWSVSRMSISSRSARLLIYPYRLHTEHSVERIAEQLGADRIRPVSSLCYEDHVNRDVHLALVHGEPAG